MPNFVEIGPSIAEIFRFFDFLKWPSPLSRILEIALFYWLIGSAGLICITVPNFVNIGQSDTKILRSYDYSRWSTLPSWFLK